MSTNVAGIDIGSGNLKIALYKPGASRLISVRMPENMFDNTRIVAPESMAQFIKQVKKEHKVNVSNCALVLPYGAAYFRHITLPAMTTDQLELNLPYEFKDYVTADSSSYYYDYIVASTEYDEAGVPKKLELYAAAVLKQTIEDYKSILRRSGFKLKVALPREMAYAAILEDYIQHNPTAVSQEFCIVDIGNKHTNIEIYAGTAHMASKNVECGCRDIDIAVADALDIDQFVANTYRISDYENALSLPECVAVYNRIAVEVVKTINFYNFDNPGNDLKDIYFCGTGAEIAPLIAVIDEQTNMQTHKIDELMPPDVAGSESLSSCALALGMAINA